MVKIAEIDFVIDEQADKQPLGHPRRGDKPMEVYRCFMLDSNQHVIGPADLISAENDRDAIDEAKRRCGTDPPAPLSSFGLEFVVSA